MTFAAKFAAGFFGVLALEAFCMTCYYVSLGVWSLLIVGESEWGDSNDHKGLF